jgi:hypothetical protein
MQNMVYTPFANKYDVSADAEPPRLDQVPTNSNWLQSQLLLFPAPQAESLGAVIPPGLQSLQRRHASQVQQTHVPSGASPGKSFASIKVPKQTSSQKSLKKRKRQGDNGEGTTVGSLPKRPALSASKSSQSDLHYPDGRDGGKPSLSSSTTANHISAQNPEDHQLTGKVDQYFRSAID